MTEARAHQVLRWSAVLTAVGLGLMLWSIAVPTALPVVLAMSVGQGFGTLAFALYGWVVVSELRAGRRRDAANQAAGDAASPEAAAAKGGAPPPGKGAAP